MTYPSYKQAHPLARPFMDEDFYYSPIEESGPFGSDDAADTFAGFCRWRPGNQEASPLEYLRQQFKDWGYPPIDGNEQDERKMEQYGNQDELALTLLIGMDAAVVALGFAQLYLEGTVAAELRQLVKRAIDRQLHPRLLELWDVTYRPIREEQLLKMLNVINRL